MSSAYLKSKMDERAGIADSVTSVLDKCAAESRDPSPEERQRLDDWQARVRTLDTEIVQLRTSLEANDRFVDVIGAVARSDENAERRATTTADREREPEYRSVGDAFVNSEQFREYGGRGTMAPVEFEDFLGVEARAALPGAITVGQLHLPPTRWDGPAGPTLTTPFLDVIGRERVSSGSVDFITWAPNPATGAAIVPETDIKPEAVLAPTQTALTLDTYAFWKAISRQTLEDYPRIRSIVETKLRQGLAAKLEADAAAKLIAATIPAAPGADLAGIRTAIGVLQGKGYSPNAILLNPADFAALDVALFDGSVSGTTSIAGTYWGVRPVPVPGLPVGTAYVGDVREGVTWFDRGTGNVFLTDSHADFFIRNTFVILAETRAAFAVTNPDSLAEVTITQTPPVAAAASK